MSRLTLVQDNQFHIEQRLKEIRARVFIRDILAHNEYEFISSRVGLTPEQTKADARLLIVDREIEEHEELSPYKDLMYEEADRCIDSVLTEGHCDDPPTLQVCPGCPYCAQQAEADTQRILGLYRARIDAGIEARDAQRLADAAERERIEREGVEREERTTLEMERLAREGAAHRRRRMAAHEPEVEPEPERSWWAAWLGVWGM
jgi:hypothetical protein